MVLINEKECEHLGLDVSEVKKIGRGIERYMRKADKLGVYLFGGSGGGQLRYTDIESGDYIVADLEGHYDGGVGDTCIDEKGFERGETWNR